MWNPVMFNFARNDLCAMNSMLAFRNAVNSICAIGLWTIS